MPEKAQIPFEFRSKRGNPKGVSNAVKSAEKQKRDKSARTTITRIAGSRAESGRIGRHGPHADHFPQKQYEMAVKYYTDDCRYRYPQKRLTAQWLREVAQSEGYELGDVCYIFCSAQRLLEMNRQYLGHDYYTDVITFDYSDRKGTHIVSGDIFIDVETVADNARQYGATTLQEMRRVVVHGVLHLCGQGDKTPRTNAQMHRKEDKYLKFWEDPRQ